MNDQDDRSVLTLHNQRKFICYYSELDPFAGKWRWLPPEKVAERAVKVIKILCLAFHHVIIPPGYLIKNPAMWIVLNRLKPLFEHGLLSFSIDRKFLRQPFLCFEQRLEEEVFHDLSGSELSSEKRHGLTRQMKTLLENGYFLFRDSMGQASGFGNAAENLSGSLARESGNRPKALIEGIKRLKDEGLISSREHWMALLHHPSYHPPPDVVESVSNIIHYHYFQQGWIGNHCVMYPSSFLTAYSSSRISRFPLKWFAFHASVIAEVISHHGVNPGTVFNLPLNCFIHDLACMPEMDLWRQAYHAQAEEQKTFLLRHLIPQLDARGLGKEPLCFSHTELGKRIADRLIDNLNNIGIFMQRAVSQLLLKAENPTPCFQKNKSMNMPPALLPGARFLDLKIRMACGWAPRKEVKKNHYVISFQEREISGPDGRKAKFDRAPFLLFLALLQKNGHVLAHQAGIALMERITREVYGPILLQQWDPPADIRSETPISYPEMNRIIAKLRRQLEKIGLDHAVITVRTEGWRLVASGEDFVFRDLPATLSETMETAFLSIDINRRKIRHLDKTCRLGPLPFLLLQLLIRYNGVPVGTRLINLELGLVREPLSSRQYNDVQARVRQYFKILRNALSAIEAPVQIVSEYGIGWRLSPFK